MSLTGGEAANAAAMRTVATRRIIITTRSLVGEAANETAEKGGFNLKTLVSTFLSAAENEESITRYSIDY